MKVNRKKKEKMYKKEREMELENQQCENNTKKYYI